MSAWQAIESAPKGGTRILLFCPDGKEKIAIGQHCHMIYIVNGSVDGEYSYWEAQGSGRYANPTHWMPLPEDPEATDG